MMKGLIHKFYCEMYKTNMTVCFDKDTFTRKFYKDAQGELGGCCAYISDEMSVNIYLEKHNAGISVPDCAHEAYHAADMIFDKCGMEYKEGSANEHMAYLVGWITHKIFDCLELDNEAEGLEWLKMKS